MSNVLDEVNAITEKMIRLSPGISTENRVLTFQPVFQIWKKAEHDYKQGKKLNYGAIFLEIEWNLKRNLPGASHEEIEQLADVLTRCVKNSDFDILTAVWETLWVKENEQN